MYLCNRACVEFSIYLLVVTGSTEMISERLYGEL